MFIIAISKILGSLYKNWAKTEPVFISLGRKRNNRIFGEKRRRPKNSESRQEN